MPQDRKEPPNPDPNANKHTLAELLPGPDPTPPPKTPTPTNKNNGNGNMGSNGNSHNHNRNMMGQNMFDDPIMNHPSPGMMQMGMPMSGYGPGHQCHPSGPQCHPSGPQCHPSGPQCHPSGPHHQCGPHCGGMHSSLMHGPGGHGKVYPPNQPMVFNPSNPNAPPIYPCGICHKEVHENDQAILCESGCNFWFHRTCTGLTELAFTLLKREVCTEWVCDACISTKKVPFVKFKP